MRAGPSGWLAGIVALAAISASCDRALIVQRDAGAPPEVPRGARLPERPDVDDEGSTDERIYVLRDPILNQQPDRWRTLGWDLDGRCTEPPEAMDAGVGVDGGGADAGGADGGASDPWAGWDLECTPRRPTSAGPVVDGDACRDNAFGAYLTLALAALRTDVQADAQARMERGEYALLVRLRGYDGSEDDPLVEVDAWPTVYGAPAGGMRGEPLLWDGSDELWLARESFSSVDEDRALIRDPQAYVSGGRLVMRIPTRADFNFASSEVLLRLRITDATISARIDADPAQPLRDVVISGRWPLADFFDQLPLLGLCPGDPADEAIAQLVRDGVEPVADVAAEPVVGDPPPVPCEAVSVAVGLTGYPARIGGLASFEIPPGVCPGSI